MFGSLGDTGFMMLGLRVITLQKWQEEMNSMGLLKSYLEAMLKI